MNLLLVLIFSCFGLARAADEACGGTFRGFQYTITSPNYPSNYPTGTECIYRLEGEASAKCEQQFHLQFLDFNLKASEACRADYLQVGDKHFYCGNAVGLRKFTGKNNTLTLTFHSDGKGTDKGFKILVSALPCSLKLSPLKNPLPKIESLESARSSLQARGIRGSDGTNLNNSLTRSLNPSTSDVDSSIRRAEFNSAAASEKHSIIKGNRYGDSPRITSYLFLPPKQNNANVTLHYGLGPFISDKSADQSTSDFLPPRINSMSSFSVPSIETASTNVKKIGVPARNYGEPGLGAVDYDLQVGNDCDRNNQLLQPNYESSDRNNYVPIQAPGYGSSPNLVYDPKYGLVGSGSGNYPGSGYNPGSSYNPDLGYNPGSGYNPGLGYNPGSSYNPGMGYYPSVGGINYPPNVGYPTGYPENVGSGFYPVGGVNPSYPGINPGNPSIGGSLGFAGSECCQVPSTRRFSIVSPGFPTGIASNNQLTCRYTIVKSSPDVCRLRLNFRFFNFGADDPYCSLGYVDIDGQRFCGCRTGQSFQVLFTDYIAKTISIFNPGYQRSKLTGFLIDVVQEPCNIQFGNSPYNPAYPGGYLQRRSVNVSSIIPSPVDPNPLIRDKRDLGYSYQKPNIPFLDKHAEFIPNGVNGQTTHERFFAGNCQSRLFFDWAIASKEALFKNARCPSRFGNYGFTARQSRSLIDGEEESSDCEEINETQGDIKSPFYPNEYPSDVRKCYRFNRAPNFCKLEVHVRDFDLESSQDCSNDYLSFSVEEKKYCGRSLNDFKTMFDLTQTSSLEVDFVSDDRGTGRGFDITFMQLPC